MSRVIFAAGGTGGHIFPALAVAEAVRDRLPDAEIVFVGTGKEIEKRLVGKAGYRLVEIPFVPVSGAGLKGKLRLLFAIPRALSRAFRLYSEKRPVRVIGFGGYPAFIPLLAAWLLRIPSALHEQNVKVGLANKVLSLLASQLYAVRRASGFWSRKPVLCLSNPVRSIFQYIAPWKQPATGEAWNVLILGGSQGAVSLNNAILELIPFFKQHAVHLLHQAGAKDAERVRGQYRENEMANAEVFDFADDMAALYAKAHIVICRAGAMTVAEVSASGRAAIYVPLRLAGGHQADNVEHLRIIGAARVIMQGDKLGSELQQELGRLFGDPGTLARMAELARQDSLHGELSSAQVIAQNYYPAPSKDAAGAVWEFSQNKTRCICSNFHLALTGKSSAGR